MNFEYKMINGKTTLTVNGKPVDLNKYKSNESIEEIVKKETKKEGLPSINVIIQDWGFEKYILQMSENEIVLSKQNCLFGNEKIKLNFSKQDIKLLYYIYKRDQYDFKKVILSQYNYQCLNDIIDRLQIRLNELNKKVDKEGLEIDNILNKYDK